MTESDTEQNQQTSQDNRIVKIVKMTEKEASEDKPSLQITTCKAESDKSKSLSTLPSEIICLLLNHLPYRSACALRLTSHNIRTKSLFAFKAKYLTTKTIDFRDSSLEFTEITLKAWNNSTTNSKRHTLDDLEEWSCHDFASSIKTLRFQPFHARNLKFNYTQFNPCDPMCDVRHPAIDNVSRRLIESKKILKIFSRLPELNEIEILPETPDFQRCGCLDSGPEIEFPQITKICMGVVLTTISQSERKIHKFGMREHWDGRRSEGVQLSVLYPIIQDSNLHVCKTLRCLELSIRAFSAQPMIESRDAFVRFLSAASALEELKLCCEGTREGKEELMDDISKVVKLPKLRMLRLRNVFFEEKTFLRFLENHSTSLQCLELKYCTIFLESGETVAHFIHTLQVLWDKLLNLKEFRISDLTRHHRGSITIKEDYVGFPNFNPKIPESADEDADNADNFCELDNESWVLIYRGIGDVCIGEDQDFKSSMDRLMGCCEIYTGKQPEFLEGITTTIRDGAGWLD